MKVNTNCYSHFNSSSNNSDQKSYPSGSDSSQARSRKLPRGINSEHYPVQGRKDRPGKLRKKDSSTSSSDSKEETRPQVSAIESDSKRLNLLLGYFRTKPLESTFTEQFPVHINLQQNFLSGSVSARASIGAEGPIRPVIALRTESSCGGIKNKSIFDSCVSDKTCLDSTRSRRPRIGESLCRHLIQSAASRKSKCSYFHLKAGNFVSPKIVKASRSYRPRIHESIDLGHTIERTNERQLSHKKLHLIFKGEYNSIGSTDKSKVKKEEIKRIFKLGQFKSRAASDLFLDNYKKRISFQLAESVISPRESIPVAPVKNFSLKVLLKKEGMKPVKGEFLLLKGGNNSKGKIAVNYTTSKT